jgi:membrane-bound ClpP family serine protease
MNDYVVSAVTYGIAVIALWRFTRKSQSGYVRWQWRRPQWILGRLLAVFVVLHTIFFLSNISHVTGYALFALFCGLAIAVDFSGLVFVAIAFVGRVIYEWIFWFPSRHELILRTRKSSEAEKQEHLVGELGQTLSDLKLVGKIEVNGQKFYARSEAGFVGKGEKVRVSAVGDFELVVRPARQEPKVNGS